MGAYVLIQYKRDTEEALWKHWGHCVGIWGGIVETLRRHCGDIADAWMKHRATEASGTKK